MNDQAPIRPLTCTLFNVGTEGFVNVGLGRDVTVTFSRERVVMLEINGMQYAPISTHIHTEWFKALQHGGLEPVLKDYSVIERMIMDYLFDAAIKTRLGESA